MSSIIAGRISEIDHSAALNRSKTLYVQIRGRDEGASLDPRTFEVVDLRRMQNGDEFEYALLARSGNQKTYLKVLTSTTIVYFHAHI